MNRMKKGAHVKKFLVQPVCFFLIVAAFAVLSPRILLAEIETKTSEAKTLESPVSKTQTEAQTSENNQEKPQIDPKEIQKALTEAGFYKGPIDGILGKKTRAAVRSFQEKHVLTPDGVCGPKTWEKLKVYLEEAQAMDAVDQKLTTPTVDEGASVSANTDVDPWAEEAPASEDSGALKQKLVS